jgi:hypothetical protein
MPDQSTTRITATDQLVAEMREWLAGCEWVDTDADEIREIAPERIVATIERHYEGGVRRFITDGL